MTFLNPLALLGLAAASIPILLHLFNLRKLQTVDFSTLTFLKELQKTRIRRLKITQLILLLLRVLIVAFAVLAFARPAIKTSFPGLGAKAKSSVVIILDNSFSMEVADERGARLKQAKDAALNILKTLGDGDEAAVVQMADLTDKRFFEFTRDFGMLREEVQKIPVSYTAARLEAALRVASGIVSNSKNLNREVFIITDAQKNILDTPSDGAQADSLKFFDASTALYVVPIGVGSKAGERNLSVDSLKVVTRIFESGKPVEVEARVRNSSNEAVQGVIVSMMMNGERVAQRTVDIPAGGTRTMTIAAAAPERDQMRGSPVGLVRASVEVEGDVLDADNRRYFGFTLPQPPRLAIVGAPQDAEFVRLALAPGSTKKNTVSVLPPEALSAANLNEFDAVFVVNVPRFSVSDLARLQNFVASGGGVFVFAGDKSDVQSYNSTILSTFQLGQAVVREYQSGLPAEFSAVDKAHPLFAGVFKSQIGATTDAAAQSAGRTGVESPKFLRTAPLLRESVSAQSIIEVPDGVFLVASKVGSSEKGEVSAGKSGAIVFYCAAPPTTAWGNFPVTGVFVTIVNRAATLMTATPSNGMDATVGQTVNITLSGRYGAGTFTLLDPNNTESLRQAASLPSGAIVKLDALRQPGVYALQSQTASRADAGAEGSPIVQTVAVNPPSSESAITLLAPDELVKKLAERTPSANQIRVVEHPEQFNPDVLRAGAGTELWRVFLLAALLCAIAEMLVSRRAATAGQE
jgi:hypothetical protein